SAAESGSSTPPSSPASSPRTATGSRTRSSSTGPSSPRRCRTTPSDPLEHRRLTMVNLGSTFDATTVDPTSSYDLFPPGRYVVQIVQSEMRPNRNGNGQGLSLELEVLKGPVVGRRMFDRLNLVHPNAQTVEM